MTDYPGPGLPLSREDYFRWAESQPKGRFERIEGVVVAMAPERAIHAKCKASVWLALRQATIAASLPCEVYPAGMTVSVEDNDFEPDALLRCGAGLPDNALVVPDPIVVVEVLSPSTQGNDQGRKLAGYFLMQSMRHYLIVWPNRRRVIHHRRRDDGAGIDTSIVTEGDIRLGPPGIAIRIEDIYAL